LHQVDQPPARHAIETGLRPGLDGTGKGGAMLGVQDGCLSRSLVIQQARRTLRVEPDHPIANDL